MTDSPGTLLDTPAPDAPKAEAPAPEAPTSEAAAPGPPAMADFRSAMGRFPTGVTLLTAGSGDDTVVMTLNSLTSVSLEPLLLLVSVKADGRMRPRASRRGSFAVNLLTEEQRDLAQEFCRPDRPSGRAAVRRLGAVEGVTGNAVLPDAEAYFECALDAEHVAGDHVLLVGRVVALSATPRASEPLVFHEGRYTRLPRPVVPAPAAAATSTQAPSAAPAPAPTAEGLAA